MNAVTPESSPLPTPQHKKGEIEVIIPPNIRDPLNLAGDVEDDNAYVASFASAKRVKKSKKKKKNKSSTGSGKEDNGDVRSDESKGEEIIELELKKDVEETSVNVAEVSVDETKSAATEVIDEVDNNIKKESINKIETTIGPTPAKRPCNLLDRSISLTGQSSTAIGPVIIGSGQQNPLNTPTGGGGNIQNPLLVTTGGGTTGATNMKVQRKFDNKDKIVSPVVPQPGAWQDRHHHVRRKQSLPAAGGPQITAGSNIQMPKFKEANKRFQYGNYHSYYGYRNAHEEDARLRLICQRLGVTFFQGKDVLDVGCNSGLLTTSVARDLGAKHVVGIDIDKTLINVAKSSLKRYAQAMKHKSDKFKQGEIFPLSMPVVYGSLNIPGVKDSPFPRNISFIQGNYVLENDVLLDLEKPQFDVILCMSVTKWFHLNWGDEGLKRVFKRMYAQLRPGGVLILEPQSLASYKKKKNLTETTWKNYQNIKLLPSNFTNYLLTEIGFSKCESIGSPYNPSKGFQRPIKLFTKSRIDNENTISSSNKTPIVVTQTNSSNNEVTSSSSTSKEVVTSSSSSANSTVEESTKKEVEESMDITSTTTIDEDIHLETEETTKSISEKVELKTIESTICNNIRPESNRIESMDIGDDSKTVISSDGTKSELR
ncbi:hypothetical protein O3M35_012763 [Rhynocoris fuscipes]